ncbi:hypothetical protein PCE1_001906 [Barthelona sp. PCE]
MTYALERELNDPRFIGFCTKEKHVFVNTLAGTPVYCRHIEGDDPIDIAAFSAYINVILIALKDENDVPLYISSENTNIVFLRDFPFIFGIVSHLKEPVRMLMRQSLHVNAMVGLALFGQHKKWAEQSRNIDVSKQISDFTSTLHALVDRMSFNPCFNFVSNHVLPLANALRNELSRVVDLIKNPNLLMAGIFFRGKLVSLTQQKRLNVSPMELHLLSTILYFHPSLNDSENQMYTFMPISLPYTTPGSFYVSSKRIGDDCVIMCLSDGNTCVSSIQQLNDHLESNVFFESFMRMSQYDKERCNILPINATNADLKFCQHYCIIDRKLDQAYFPPFDYNSFEQQRESIVIYNTLYEYFLGHPYSFDQDPYKDLLENNIDLNKTFDRERNPTFQSTEYYCRRQDFAVCGRIVSNRYIIMMLFNPFTKICEISQEIDLVTKNIKKLAQTLFFEFNKF